MEGHEQPQAAANTGTSARRASRYLGELAFDRAESCLLADKRSGGQDRRCLSWVVREFAECLVRRTTFDRREETRAERDT